jgi:type I restriction enzyme M protein
MEDAAPVEITQIQKDEFLERLRTAAGQSGNIKLRGQLGWDEPTYDAVRNALVACRQIITGRGRGGSVSLVD